MEHVNAGRALMGDSLGFHILFVMFGIALPLLTLIMEYWSIKRKSESLRKVAKLWSYIATVLVVTGVISGTVVALQMFFVWPGILEFGGEAVGVGFMWEGYAFLLEAIFLAYYVSTWDKIKGFKHLLIGIPIPLGALLSGIIITSVNAWMNHPTGFEYVNGQLINPQPLKALFNETSFLEVTHSMFAYYGVVAMLMAGAYAWVGLKNKKALNETVKFIIVRMSIIALICMGIVGFLGDRSAKYLAREEPTKLAAIELLTETQSNAPLRFGGRIDESGEEVGGIVIPDALSILGKGDPNAVIEGLDKTPKTLWPPLIIHTLFDIKMFIVALLLLIPSLFIFLYYRSPKKAFSKPMLISLTTIGLLGVVAIELGWMLTELGRQPWAVYGYVLTKDAFTTSPGVQQLGYLFPAVFVLLFIATYFGLKKTIERFNKKNKGVY
ncbi:MAG TPA: cytochrome ubiquinol oxidase subunit I [Candidatus Saccharibacteria bacterium]|jgi:cytochrome d ubiquinol oxidase subunit I|nr:cytochrome ubiquinol oxidase subunit I [Candidatus Saccharibacteria bacterium]